MQNEKKQQKVFAVGFSLIVFVIIIFMFKPIVLNRKEGQRKKAEQKANEEILKAQSITAEDFFSMTQKKSEMVIVDVSLPEDFKRGHIASSLNERMENLDRSFFNSRNISRTAEIILLNQGGDLENLAKAVNRVVDSGFANARYLRGGISDWQEKGFPLISSGGSESDDAKVKKISIEEIKADAASNADLLQFLDVRDKSAYASEHIVGAINIPPAELEFRKNEIPLVKKIIIYGAEESESFQAAVTLFDLNFFNAYQMQGTIDDWREAGGNIE